MANLFIKRPYYIRKGGLCTSQTGRTRPNNPVDTAIPVPKRTVGVGKRTFASQLI
jgi:hypothetical protein